MTQDAIAPNRQTCLWCGGAFTPRVNGGKAQRFCSPSCRRQLHTRARQWAIARIEDGTIPVGLLRDNTPSNVNVALVRKSVGDGPRKPKISSPLPVIEKLEAVMTATLGHRHSPPVTCCDGV